MKFELTKEFIQEITGKIERQEFQLIKTELSELHNVDIAELIEELDEEHGKILFELFEDETSAEILIELDEESRESVLEDLSSKEIAEELIENLESDDAADIIAEFSSEKKVEILSHIEDVDHAPLICRWSSKDGSRQSVLSECKLHHANHLRYGRRLCASRCC